MELISGFLKEGKEGMESVCEHAQTTFSKFRVNRVDPDMLSSVRIDYYGVPSTIEKVASIGVEDAATLVIKPWEKKMLIEIERGIARHNEHGFSTRNDGETVWVTRPPLTEETRIKLAKQVKNKGEEAKIKIRGIRQKIKELIKKEIVDKDEIKVGEEKLQELTNEYIKKIEEMQIKKEQELMKV